VGNETVTTVSELELIELTDETEDTHYQCWDCFFDICGNGGYDDDTTVIIYGEDDPPSCDVCNLMDELNDFKDVPCKHCGSTVWAVPPGNRR
jgi:hypothetical protein